MHRRIASYATTFAALALTLTACATSTKTTATQSAATSPSVSGSSTSTGTSAAKGEVVIGAADFSESALLAQMYAQLLTKAGYTTKLQTVGKRELYEPALEQGQIDVVPDYLATMAEFLNAKVNGAKAATAPIATSDAAATAAALRTIATPLGLTVLEPSKAIDANAFAVTKAYAAAHKLKTLSDLGASGLSVNLAATEECPTRPFCGIALKDKYGIKIAKNDPLGFGTTQTKQAVKSGKDDLGLVGSTDGTLDSFGLVILEDDKHIQLADNLVAIVGKKFATDTALAAALNALNAALTTTDLAALEVKVDGERQKPADVAKAYLTSKGLL
ncbi:MAG: osmoprotectant transport system substrate-binding protein [Frankiaceae bacterium]|nr:osmoprotectant transport system substrate-binding protein [Frankiaceae bacterium]